MNWIPFLLALVVIGVSLLLLSAVFAEPISLRLRRYFPNVQFEEESFLLWGLLFSAAFVLGVIILYLVQRFW